MNGPRTAADGFGGVITHGGPGSSFQRQGSLDDSRPRRKRHRVTENDDFHAFLERIVRAAGRRAADDLVAFANLAQIGALVETQLRAAAHRQHDVHDRSYADLAAPLGISKQAVHSRWFAGAKGAQS